jgi:hypothetical protein
MFKKILAATTLVAIAAIAGCGNGTEGGGADRAQTIDTVGSNVTTTASVDAPPTTGAPAATKAKASTTKPPEPARGPITKEQLDSTLLTLSDMPSADSRK